MIDVGNAHEFPVETRTLYFPIQDKYGNVSYSEALAEGKNKVKGVVRNDTNVLLGVCSERYKIIEHKVVKDYADRLIKELDYDVSSARLDLPSEGSTMLYYSILDNQEYNIGNDTKIKAVIECKNSYNGKENASINVVFINEENTIFGFGFKKESKVANSVFVAHKGNKVKDKIHSEFGGLVEYIPNTIKNTVELWNDWDKQQVSGKRIKLLCRGISAGFAKYLEEKGIFDTGCSRFEFYKHFCKYNLNLGTIGKFYKTQKLSIGPMNQLFIFDDFYNENPEFAIKSITKIAKFDYNDAGEINLKYTRKSKTYLALERNEVDTNYHVKLPEQIVAESQPETKVEETPTIIKPESPKEEPKQEPKQETPVVVEEDNSNNLLAGW